MPGYLMLHNDYFTIVLTLYMCYTDIVICLYNALKMYSHWNLMVDLNDFDIFLTTRAIDSRALRLFSWTKLGQYNTAEDKGAANIGPDRHELLYQNSAADYGKDGLQGKDDGGFGRSDMSLPQ